MAYLLLLLLLLLPAAAPATPDLRVLIDVSGSMRRNDPNNLRVPALRLLAQFLPAGTGVGIWLFAEGTEALIPPGKVDDAWRARIRAQLEKVHARGLFTDIEGAIQAATTGWENPAQAGERHLLLLTDGLVDISAGADASAASRARLLAEWIPRLQEAKVKVHAVALSDEVDRELLERLTGRTGGWLEAAGDADALQRIFLHMLEQTAPPTTVPLVDNRFQIDAGISEFTVLIFHEPTAQAALIAPDGTRIATSQHGETVRWRSEPGYDLITVTQPPPGDWRIEGAADPDNRVVVVTDLGLATGDTPGSLPAGEMLPVTAWVTDHGQPVNRLDFLELMTVTAGLKPVDGPGGTATLVLTLDRDQARYRGGLETATLPPGTYEFEALLDSATLQRQTRRRLRVLGAPVTLRHEVQLPETPGATAALRVTLEIDRERIDPASLSGYVSLRGTDDPAAPALLAEITPATDGGNPALTLPVARPGGYSVATRLTARTTEGAPSVLHPPVEQVRFDFEAPPPDPVAATHETWSWPALALYVGVGNLILLPLLGVTWLFLRAAPGNATPKPGRTPKKVKAVTA